MNNIKNYEYFNHNKFDEPYKHYYLKSYALYEE